MKSKGIVMMIAIATISLIAILIINYNNQSFLEKEGLEGLTTVQMVEKLEAKTIDPNKFNASITATTLSIITQVKTYTYDVPSDLFYLSIAPYLNQTHPCGTHSLVTCRGELKNKSFDVLIKDDQGTVIFDQTVSSGSNGFAGIWLPRNMEGTIYVEYGDYSATTDIQTYNDSNTCLTTMKLTP
ncbi:MAG: CueP family metal-binding protein [Acholeplasmataceae bacterium]|nr:CueP family metal-binding protein [Acholeplasmataceae bacterium]